MTQLNNTPTVSSQSQSSNKPPQTLTNEGQTANSANQDNKPQSQPVQANNLNNSTNEEKNKTSSTNFQEPSNKIHQTNKPLESPKLTLAPDSIAAKNKTSTNTNDIHGPVLTIDPDFHFDNIDGEDLLHALKTTTDDNLVDALKFDANDPRSRKTQALDAMLTMEIAKQDGVKISGDVVSVPGRVALSLHTLLQTLLAVITLSTTFVHFMVYQRNFLLAVFVVFVIQIGAIIIYHTAYRARRTGIRIFQLLSGMIFTALVDWGYIDQIFNFPDPEMKFVLLIIGLFAFNLILILNFAHLIYFGRGSRSIMIKR